MDDSVRYIAEEAARRIARFGKAEAEGPLTEHLCDMRPRMRIIAAQNLARIGSKWAIGPLTSALRDSSWRMRADAAEALGLLGDTSMIRALVPLGTDPVWEVRNHSLWARGRLGDSTATEQLIAQCKEPRQSQVEFLGNAFGALSHISTRRVTEALVEMLADQSGQYKVGKAAVITKLALRPDPDAKAALAGQYESKFIEVDDSTLVRIGAPAVKYLITRKPALILKIGREAADPVAAAMDTARDGNRIQCAKILVQLGDPRGRAALAAALRDTATGDRAQRVRGAAAQTIADLGDRSFGPALLGARRVPGWGRSEIYKTLAKLGYPGTASALLSDLRVSPTLREDIVDALGELHDVKALPTLDSLAANGEVRSRIKAARTMLRIAPGSAVPHLILLLAEENSWLVAQAADMLGEAGDPRAAEPLVLLLHDKRSEARTAALSALARIPSRRAEDEVLAYLHSSRDDWDWYRAYPAVVRRNESWSEAALIRLLLENGNDEMAKAYVESGNPNLRDAARVWMTGREWAWHWYDLTRPPLPRM